MAQVRPRELKKRLGQPDRLNCGPVCDFSAAFRCSNTTLPPPNPHLPPFSSTLVSASPIFTPREVIAGIYLSFWVLFRFYPVRQNAISMPPSAAVQQQSPGWEAIRVRLRRRQQRPDTTVAVCVSSIAAPLPHHTCHLLFRLMTWLLIHLRHLANVQLTQFASWFQKM